MDAVVIKLLDIFKTMDLPEQRIQNSDWKWINRNILFRNSEHPQIDEAMDLLSTILKRKDK